MKYIIHGLSISCFLNMIKFYTILFKMKPQNYYYHLVIYRELSFIFFEIMYLKWNIDALEPY